MNKYAMFSALAVAATLCACTREPLDNNTDPEVNSRKEVMVTIKASLEGCSDPETKTYLSGETLNQYDTPLWKAGDKFRLVSDWGGTTDFTLKAEDAGKTDASFSGTMDFNGQTPVFYAVYPSSLPNISRNADPKTISFDLPQTQNGSANDASGQMPAFAFAFRPLQPAEKRDEPIVLDGVAFRNICGLFRIALTCAAPVKVGKLEIIDKNGDALWGNASINRLSSPYNYDLSNYIIALSNDNENKSTLTINYSEPVTLNSSSPTYFYAAVPPGTLSKGVTVKVYDEKNTLIDQFGKTDNDGGLTVSRAHIKPMKVKSIKYTSLSDVETANCYIVENQGLHRFLAVKGNTETSVGEVASAEVLWESIGTATAPSVGDIVSSVSCDGEYVYFTATGTAGNASIAVKDSENNILWSWHIWVPSTEVTSETYSTGSKPTVMDRNLGALVAYDNDAEASVNALSNGLIYQWGRKDPFPGLATYGSSKETVATCTFTVEASTADTGTTGYATLHPTVFLSKNPSADWMASPNADLWGGADQDTKTEWDPCPPGYKVPNLVLGDFAVESGANAVKLDGKHWYPTTGEYYAYDGDLHNVSGGYYWTTNNASSSGSRYYTSTNSTFTQGSSGIARGMGMAVRCVAE